MYGYGPAPDDIRARALAIEATCQEHKVPLIAAALLFPLLHWAVDSVMPGAVTPDQVRQNAANVERPIPGELWVALKDRGLIDGATPIGD